MTERREEETPSSSTSCRICDRLHLEMESRNHRCGEAGVFFSRARDRGDDPGGSRHIAGSSRKQRKRAEARGQKERTDMLATLRGGHSFSSLLISSGANVETPKHVAEAIPDHAGHHGVGRPLEGTSAGSQVLQRQTKRGRDVISGWPNQAFTARFRVLDLFFRRQKRQIRAKPFFFPVEIGKWQLGSRQLPGPCPCLAAEEKADRAVFDE